MPDDLTPASELAVLALRYAANDLSTPDADAFEMRLAHDQAARDALAEAIRLSAAALGQLMPTPSSAVRANIRDRLFPTWLTRWFPRRSYRGHPAAWAGAGALVAVAALLGINLSESNPPLSTPPPGGHSTFKFVASPLVPPADALQTLDGTDNSTVRAAEPIPMPMPMPKPAEPAPANG